jgi:hypothetical protein
MHASSIPRERPMTYHDAVSIMRRIFPGAKEDNHGVTEDTERRGVFPPIASNGEFPSADAYANDARSCPPAGGFRDSSFVIR